MKAAVRNTRRYGNQPLWDGYAPAIGWRGFDFYFISVYRNTPFSYEDYDKARQENIETVNKSLTDSDKNFLLSFLKGEPQWTENYNFSQYPPIRWKLMNFEKLKTMNLEKFNSQVELLENTLENRVDNFG